MAYDLPRKVRVETVQAPQLQPGNQSAEVAVIAEKPGTVTVIDRAKAYYHTIILAVGGTLIALNEATPLTDSLPEGVKSTLTVVIAVLTLILNIFKSNEVWVNKL